MKSIALAEIMPDAGEYAETVADDRAEYDAGHAHEIGQYDRKKNISAYLEPVADVVAQLIAVTVNHLLKIENNYRQKRVYRGEAVISESLFEHFSLNTVYAEIRVLYEKYGKCGQKPDRNADYKSLTVYFVSPFLSHCSYFSCEHDAYACRYKISEECYYARYRGNGIYRRNSGLSDKKSRNNAVAQQHEVHDSLGEGTGYEHGTEFSLTKSFHFSASDNNCYVYACNNKPYGRRCSCKVKKLLPLAEESLLLNIIAIAFSLWWYEMVAIIHIL